MNSTMRTNKNKSSTELHITKAFQQTHMKPRKHVYQQTGINTIALLDPKTTSHNSIGEKRFPPLPFPIVEKHNILTFHLILHHFCNHLKTCNENKELPPGSINGCPGSKRQTCRCQLWKQNLPFPSVHPSFSPYNLLQTCLRDFFLWNRGRITAQVFWEDSKIWKNLSVDLMLSK